MPIVTFQDRKGRIRYRFSFRRRIARKIVGASKILPPGTSKANADAYDRRETARLYALHSGLERDSPLIEDAVVAWMEEHAPNLSDGVKSGQTLELLYDFYAGKRFSELDDIAQSYRRANHARLSPATIRNRLAVLLSVLRWAWHEKKMGRDAPLPALRQRAPKNYRTTRATIDEIRQLLRHIELDEAGRDTRALVRICYYTALRSKAEAHALTKGQLRWNREDPLDVTIVCGQTKNGDPHEIPAHPAVIKSLRRIPLATAYQTCYDRFKKAAAAIGRPELILYDMRRSAASDVLSAGHSLSAVGVLLNHKSAQATERYAWMVGSVKQELFLGLGRRNGRSKP